MADIEKNEWLETNGFKIRYPINFHMPSMMTEMEVDVYLNRLHNPNHIIFG